MDLCEASVWPSSAPDHNGLVQVLARPDCMPFPGIGSFIIMIFAFSV